MTFKEQFFEGKIPFEEIDRYTSRWNFSDETCTLAQYLGLNDEEEDVWISQSDEALEALLKKERDAYRSCPVKALFTDMDGTLLDDHQQVSPENQAAIHAALDAGHIVVLTTGRALSSTLPFARQLGLDRKGGYVITFNGGLIYDCRQEKAIYSRTLAPSCVRAVAAEARKAHIHFQAYEDGYVISEAMTPEFEVYTQRNIMPTKIVDDIPAYLTTEIPKLLLIDLNDHEKLEGFRRRVLEMFPGQVDSLFSNPQYLEVIPAGVSKGDALRRLALFLNIPPENTVAVGDSENDLSLLEAAHIGAAMSNSLPRLKEAADFVTAADHNHSGFAEVIEKYLLTRDA